MFKNEDYILKDEKGRTILVLLEDNRILYNRYPDMTEQDKSFILDLLSDLGCGENLNEVSDFLSYNGEDEFCA